MSKTLDRLLSEAMMREYGDLNGRFYTRIGRKWYCPAKTFVTLPSPYTVPLNRESRAYRWKKLEQQDE